MKSNYPRASDQPHTEVKPSVLTYSLWLGLLTFLLTGIRLAFNGAIDPTDGTVTATSLVVVVVSAVVVLSFAVILLWKCAGWRMRDKAKLVIWTASGCWVLMSAISLFFNAPRPIDQSMAWIFGAALLVLFAGWTVAGTAVWTIAWAVRWVEARVKARREGSFGETHAEELAGAGLIVAPEAEVVRTNA